MDTDQRNNFGQAIYDMFGVGGDAGLPASGADPSGLLPRPAGGTGPVEEFRVEKAVPVHTYQGTYLAAGTVTRGTITARGGVEVAGDFEGEIAAKGKVALHSNITSKITAAGLVLTACTLTGDVEISGGVNVDAQSSITGNVRAESMVCAGRIQGDLDIQDDLVLDGQAQVDGNIKVGTISMVPGAKVNGTVEMRGLKDSIVTPKPGRQD